MKIAQYLLAGLLGLAASLSHAAPLTVDGNLSDWVISVQDGYSGNTTPTDFSGLRSDLIGSMIEDSSDIAGDGGYVGPNYGGQNYDGEFMGWALQGSQFHVAILTGQRPDNGFARYSPGDLRIVTSLELTGLKSVGAPVAVMVRR